MRDSERSEGEKKRELESFFQREASSPVSEDRSAVRREGIKTESPSRRRKEN